MDARGTSSLGIKNSVYRAKNTDHDGINTKDFPLIKVLSS